MGLRGAEIVFGDAVTGLGGEPVRADGLLDVFEGVFCVLGFHDPFVNTVNVGEVGGVFFFFCPFTFDA